MSDKSFAIAFDGTLVEGARPEQVKANMAKLFKTSLDKVEPLFVGRRVAVKRGLDRETAIKYQAALRRCGAITQVVDLSTNKAAGATPAQQQAARQRQIAALRARQAAQAKAQAVSTPAVAKPAPVGEPADRSKVLEVSAAHTLDAVRIDAPERIVQEIEVPELKVDTSHLSSARVGTLLVEPMPDVDPGIAEMHVGIAPPGAQLVEPSPEEALVVDLAGLSMAAPGTQIIPPTPFEELKVDTSRLSMGG